MSTESPWQTLSVEEVYDNPWIKVEEHQVINPSGGENLYGKVCFKNVAVAVIAMDDHDNIYLVGQYRYPLGRYSWELPMGGGAKTVPLLDSAKRELKEETGLTAESWTELMRLDLSNSITDEKGIVFVARDLTPGETEFDETEDLAVQTLPWERALGMVLSGEITDAMSVAGILRFAQDLNG